MIRRLAIFVGILMALVLGTLIVIQLARGYRLDFATRTLLPTGILVATSTPDGAQVLVDGNLAGATNSTINFPPGEYLVEIKKDGYLPWQKNLIIEKELVTQTNARLFPAVPDLRPLTFTGAAGPLLSPDGSRTVFAVSAAGVEKDGLWVLDLADRPLGLARQPRRIVASSPGGRDFSQSRFFWSPDSKELLVTLTVGRAKESYSLDTNTTTLASQLVDVADQLSTIFADWEEELMLRQEQQLARLPAAMEQIVTNSAKNLLWSPDETKLAYTATASATIPENLIPPLPAANTQPESRNIAPGKMYVYDLKEDRNFLVANEEQLGPEAAIELEAPLAVLGFIRRHQPQPVSWLPTSAHFTSVEDNTIYIAEYDGTNKVAVYSGPFEDEIALPFPGADRLLILTNLGAGNDTTPNLYALSLR